MFKITTMFSKLWSTVRTRSTAAWLVAAAVFTGAVQWTQAAGATGIIEVKELTKTLESEVSANLGVILGLVGVLLAIGLIIGLARKHAKPS